MPPKKNKATINRLLHIITYNTELQYMRNNLEVAHNIRFKFIITSKSAASATQHFLSTTHITNLLNLRLLINIIHMRKHILSLYRELLTLGEREGERECIGDLERDLDLGWELARE